jgi:hypothetical protein
MKNGQSVCPLCKSSLEYFIRYYNYRMIPCDKWLTNNLTFSDCSNPNCCGHFIKDSQVIIQEATLEKVYFRRIGGENQISP